MYRIVATALWVVLQIMKLLRETGHRPVATAPPLWKSRSAPLLIIPICFLLSAVASHAAGDIGIIKGADQFEFVYRVKLPEITGEACVWIPLAKTDSFQTVTVEELNVPMKWEKAHDREYGNDICVLHPQPEDSGKTIEVRYRVVRKEKASYPANNAEAARYLRPEKLVPIDETFRTLAEKAAAGKTDDLDRAKALYDHVMGRMRYDKSGTGWGRGDAKYACDVRTGNCTDFHSYFIAPTGTKAQSRAIIAGQNFWQMDAGSRWTLAKLGKIRSSLIIILATIQRIASN